MKLPDKIERNLSSATVEQKTLFENVYQNLAQAGLALYPTDFADVRAKHAKNNIVFVGLQFGPHKGVHVEVRVDSLPIDILSTTSGTEMFNVSLKHWDSGKKPLWAIFRPERQADIESIMKVVKRVMASNPDWGK